ncbi:hypothetical protein [Paenibacillus sp. CF384]|uniref:hypothetical protein n=1 Tax=Paenibacillus sp. CF384 TaxID=1884382 RepID=UPI000897B578|nr:hypothetical protein [Paenibacillus sp. CF384]SDW89677.1 hypothetical protein SAMN05518855_1006199 [Paenibacillus sp. CF384]
MTKTSNWFDDYLDLYNFAKQLGDQQWQEELLEAMRHKNALDREEAVRSAKEELWHKFNTINHQMMDLLAQMKQSSDPAEESTIRELIGTLKLQRMDLAKKIKSLH